MRTAVPAQYKQAVLSRQAHRCNVCRMFLDVYDIDHIVPYRVHPRHTLANLQALCPTCHARKTRSEAAHLAQYSLCEKTESFRYCWSCKQVVSTYFGYTDGHCAACLRTTPLLRDQAALGK